MTRDELAREIELCEGNIRRVAARFGICREYVYIYLKKYDLWPEVNEARAHRIKAEPRRRDSLLTKARHTLKN